MQQTLALAANYEDEGMGLKQRSHRRGQCLDTTNSLEDIFSANYF